MCISPQVATWAASKERYVKIAVTGPHNDFGRALNDELRRSLMQDEVLDWLPNEKAPASDLEILIALGPVEREMLADQSKLVLVQTASDGYDEVDIQACTDLGIWVSYAPGGVSGNADSVAEYAVMLLIAANRRLHEALDFVQDNHKHRPMLSPALVGKTVCIYGYGDIGKRVAERLRPFGVRLSAVNRRGEEIGGGIEVFPADQRAKALGAADAVVLCVRGSEQNRRLVDAGFLKEMKPGATLVNIARGSLVDETALLGALQSGHLGAAGLDVQEEEPVGPENPLLWAPTAFVTPHIAGFTDHTLEGTARYLAEVVDKVHARQRFDSLLNQPEKPRLAWLA